MNLLDKLIEEFPVVLNCEAVDRRLADLLLRLDSASEGTIVPAVGAVLSGKKREGHACVPLAVLAAELFPDAPDAESMASVKAAFASSSLVGDGVSQRKPIVYRSDEARVWFLRDWDAECEVANRVAQRLRSKRATQLRPATAAALKRLFPQASASHFDAQALAALSALSSRFAILTGGPGTGKTSTVVKILAAALEVRPNLRVALSAPTGKATARLSESVASALARLELPDEVHHNLAKLQGKTLHRLLGMRPHDGSFRHDENRPIPVDFLVVDEASMIDLQMARALFAAVRNNTTLLLLGDENQLASVDTGFVLGDMCRSAHPGQGPALKNLSQVVFGMTPPEYSGVNAGSTQLDDAVVRLHHSYRFDDNAGVGRLAHGILEGDEAAIDEACHEKGGAVKLLAQDPLKSIETRLKRVIKAASKISDVDKALKRLGEFRILTANRRGRLGVEGIQRLAQSLSGGDSLTVGTPILVTANDATSGLMNGDLGVIVNRGDGLCAAFQTADAGHQFVAISRLPPFESAWAMTVHKSQGSEFDEVMVVIPDADSPLATRELLYTAVTRAKTKVTLVGKLGALVAAAKKPAIRDTGLGARILSVLSAAD